MLDFARTMSADDLIEVVKALDSVSHPLARRFEGDDTALVELMKRLNLPQDIASKSLIGGEVLRECAHRGIQVPRNN